MHYCKLASLAESTELVVSELVTNAVKVTVGRDGLAVSLRVSGDTATVLAEVWDADPRPPVLKPLGDDGVPDPGEEGGRGLFLVAMLSSRWNWYPTQDPPGKIIWCELEAVGREGYCST